MESSLELSFTGKITWNTGAYLFGLLTFQIDYFTVIGEHSFYYRSSGSNYRPNLLIIPVEVVVIGDLSSSCSLSGVFNESPPEESFS